jgi:hypothetical protein
LIGSQNLFFVHEKHGKFSSVLGISLFKKTDFQQKHPAVAFISGAGCQEEFFEQWDFFNIQTGI